MRLTASRELDLQIAKQIMGWRKAAGTKQYFNRQKTLFNEEDVPKYSTDMGAAFKIVERLLEENICISICHKLGGFSAGSDTSYEVHADKVRNHKFVWLDHAVSDNPALAICDLALKIKGE
jgi:hypothetical protein